MSQTNLTNRVPVLSGVTAVFGTPLLTLFAALWLHEFDTGLSAPTVSQLAVYLVPCFMSRESANTVGTFAVYIPVSKAEVSKKASPNHKCAHCKRILNVVDWDHKNGDRSNNQENNCQALCPNCHAIKTRKEQGKR